MDFSQKVFNAVFELPLMKNAQKRHKKIKTKKLKAKTKTEEKKPAFFVMSPDGFFRILAFVFLNSLCYETPKIMPNKKTYKK
jgi:hypothetical protein